MPAEKTAAAAPTVAKPSKNRSWLIWLLAAVLMVASIANLVLDAKEFTQPAAYVDGVLGWILAPLAFTITAALILQRRPGHRIGWLLMAVVAGLAIPTLLDHLYLAPVLAANSLTSSQLAYAFFSSYSWWLLIAPLFLIFLLYPTGELPSPRWRVAVYMLLATFIIDIVVFSLAPTLEVGGAEYSIPNPVAIFSIEQVELFEGLFALSLLVTCVIIFASVFMRYRRAQNIERAQMRWLFSAAVAFFLFYFANLLLGWDGEQDLLLSSLFAVGFIGIPVAIGVGILRYRLWDIDVVINRSIVYGLLTTILAAIFAGISGFGGQFAKTFFGEDASPVAAAVGAVVVASLFQPLRQGIEKFINRRLFAENVDISEGLGELNPDMWQFIGIKEILDSSLEHLQDIYKFDKAAIYLGKYGETYSPRAAIGTPLKALEDYTLTKQEEVLFLQKKSAIAQTGEFPVSVPLYWARRKSPQLLGILRLGKRGEGRGYSSYDIKALQTFGGKLGRPIYALDSSHR